MNKPTLDQLLTKLNEVAWEYLVEGISHARNNPTGGDIIISEEVLKSRNELTKLIAAYGNNDNKDTGQTE